MRHAPSLLLAVAFLAPAALGAAMPPAAGTPQSSGGNFAVDVAPLDPGVPLGDLLPPVDFGYTPPVFEPGGQFELSGAPLDDIRPVSDASGVRGAAMLWPQ